MSARYQGLAVFAAAIVIVVAVVGGVGAAPTPGPGADSGNETADNGTLAPHQDPEVVREDGDPGRVADYLSARLGARLNESAVAISDREFEQAQALLDEGYDEDLAKYATVASDIDEEELATQFNLTREEQASLAESLRESEELAAEYQRAAGNDDERARELARELVAQAEEINQTTAGLEDRYGVLENGTGVELDGAQTAIEEVRQMTGEAVAAIQAREFTETRLVAETNRTRIAADEPARISGRLTTANGTPIENGTVRVRLGNDTVTTETGPNGTYTATYRPILAPLNASAVTVGYAPEPSNPYLPATDTVAVSITEQAETSIELENASATAGFDDTVRATGAVDVAGVDPGAIGSIPVTLSLDGRRLATGETGPNGRVDLQGTVSATIPTGENEFRVAIDRRNAAIARSTAVTTLSVRETATALSVDGSIDAADGGSEEGSDGPDDGEADTLTVSGRLTTDGGDDPERGLAGRSVALAVDGTDIGTVETNADGTYRTTVAVPETVTGGDQVSLTASFDGTGTNLAESVAEGQVTVPATGSETDWPEIDPLVVAGFGAALVALGAVVLLRRRTGDALEGARPGTDATRAGTATAGDETRPQTAATDPVTSLVERARA
ncbi:hypothetical protein, partial [Halorubrum sp. AJ67]|uniref:hypothetical protein n=1 Tax=Halorubrum sp. AJ67 TaxID=1173487 RepID=UPI00064F07B1